MPASQKSQINTALSLSASSMKTIPISASASRSIYNLLAKDVRDQAFPKHKRFEAGVLMLFSIGFLLVLLSYSLVLDKSLLRFLGTFFVPLVAFFSYQWTAVHSIALTRKSRAFWNEANILETYQPRARLEGHLFKPDPPTPGPDMPPQLEGHAHPNETKISEEEMEGIRKEKAAFEKSRTSHYKNEFQAAVEAAKKQDDSLMPNANHHLKADEDNDKDGSDEETPKTAKENDDNN